MTRIVRGFLVALALAHASTAAAQISFDAKAAYALPVGNVWIGSPWNATQPMTNAWTGAIPIEVGVRYHVVPNTSLGAYFGWGPAFAKSPGLPGLSFDPSFGTDMRVGLELMYEFLPASAFNPWFLIGTGWEWTNLSGSGASVTFSGWEYMNLQAGIDFQIDRAFGIGPYVGFLGGAYTNITATGSAQGYGGAVPTDSRAFHGWLQIGLKGTLNL